MPKTVLARVHAHHVLPHLLFPLVVNSIFNMMYGISIILKAAKDFTVSQRQKLQELGALDIQRPMRITGEPITSNTTRQRQTNNDENENDHYQNC